MRSGENSKVWDILLDFATGYWILNRSYYNLGPNHGIPIWNGNAGDFNNVLHAIFPESKDNLNLQNTLSDQVEEIHDQNKDLFLQLDEFTEFMWDNSPNLVKEAETVKNLKHETRKWFGDIQNRANSAGFKIVSASSNNNPSSKQSEGTSIKIVGSEGGEQVIGQYNDKKEIVHKKVVYHIHK